MDYRPAYRVRKSQARKRGIAWLLTFEQWLVWWGADIDKRGAGANDLQMLRYGNQGPYTLGNIYKGRPSDNVVWYSAADKRRRTLERQEVAAMCDLLMPLNSDEKVLS